MNYTGIYEIVNTKTNTIYVGQSMNITSRLKDHKAKLINGKCTNKPLQADWDKYGENAFEFRIAKLIPTELRYGNLRFWLRREEQLRIAEIKEQGIYSLYNFAYGNKSTKGRAT